MVAMYAMSFLAFFCTSTYFACTPVQPCANPPITCRAFPARRVGFGLVMARYRRCREGSVAISEIVRFQRFKAVASEIAHASSRSYIDQHVADEALARSLYVLVGLYTAILVPDIVYTRPTRYHNTLDKIEL